MNDRPAEALICPACRTRLRVAEDLTEATTPCPECGQMLCISLVRREALCVPTSAAQKSEIHRKLLTEFLVLLTRHRIGLSTFAASLAALSSLLLLPRPSSESSISDVANLPEVMHSRLVGVDDNELTNGPDGEISLAAPPVIVREKAAVESLSPERATQVMPFIQRVDVAVAVDPPPVPESRTALQIEDGVALANAQQIPVDQPSQGPSRPELLQMALRQRFVSYQVPAKTSLRNVIRDLNELANGLIEIDEKVSADALKRPVSISLNDATLLEVLENVATASSLKISANDEAIRIHD